jgi:hybrid cluster-associated redox disulfide protein
MIVADIVNANPKASEVLESFGLRCSKCAVAWSETLQQGLAPHGIEVDLVLDKLNHEALKGEGQASKEDSP